MYKIKVYIAVILTTVVLFSAIGMSKAEAAPLILESGSDKADIMSPSPVSLVSLKAVVNVGINNSKVDLQYVLKNDTDQAVSFYIGYLENIAKVYNFSGDAKDVYINGQRPNGKQTVKLGTGDFAGLRWMVWPAINIEPGRMTIVKAQLYLRNKLYANGDQALDFPLKSLSLWGKPVEQIEVTFKFPQNMIYALDPVPQPQPSKIGNDGSLVWSYANASPTDDIVVHFKPAEYSAVEQLQSSNSSNLKALADLYDKGDYLGLLDLGQSYLSSDNSSVEATLVRILMAHTYIELLQNSEAVNLYTKILSSDIPPDLAVVATQQALFYKYQAAESQGDINAQKDILNDILALPADRSTSIFKSWASAEKGSIDAIITAQKAKEEEAKKAAQQQAALKKFNLNESIDIIGHSISLKYALLVPFILLPIIAVAVILRKRKKRHHRWYR